jgi:hypothetical protein
LGSTRRRARTYSFSGSERSVTNTPTPSDMDTADETIDTLKDEEEEEELDDVEDRQDEKDEVRKISQSFFIATILVKLRPFST